MNGAATDIAAELVHRLFVLLKAAAVYGPDNDGYRSHAAMARATLDELFAKDELIRLEAREDLLLFNGAPIRLRPGDAGARFLADEMSRRGVGSLEFRAERATSQLDAFVFAFHRAGFCRERAFDELRSLLRTGNVTSISARPPEKPEDGAPARAPRPECAAGSARRAFLQAVDVVKELMARVRAGQDADIGQAKLAVEGLAEQVVADAQILFELSLLQTFDEYTYAHSVNVCIYAVAIGGRLGLDRAKLTELGLGALFHDVGKAKLPLGLIDKPDKLDEREWQIMRLHPLLGARTLMAMRRPLDGNLARAISVAFEHHLGMNGQGYPKLPRPRRQELFSRICAVADAFDAMTSGRVYAKRAMSPDEALRRMVQGSGTAFDPLLLRIFINAIGIFPIGTALLLDTGEQGVVSRNSPADLLHPQVVVFADRRSEKPRSELVDLARQDGGAGEPRRSIRRTLDPRKQKIDVIGVLRERPATARPRPEPPASKSPEPPRP